jgi:hypothetical protein
LAEKERDLFIRSKFSVNHAYANMAGNRNLQSLSNLVKAISRLSQNSTETRNSGETQETTDDVEATIRTLFPSTNGQTEADRNETRVVAEHGALNTPDRRYPENAERFVPNRKYGTKKRPRNVKNSTSKKPKCNEQRTVLKDVILLHGPKQDKVPRGISREALFALGFTTTLELSISMQESEIRSLLEEKFKNKLESISRKGNKFQFVRAINSKIISLENTNQQECQAPCDGRLLKHISGQGPLYIRANEDIGAPLQAYNSKQKRHDKDDNTDDEMESESSTGDEEAIMRNTMYKPCPTPIVRVDLSILDDAAAPDEDSVPNCDPLPATGESSTSVPSTSTALAPEQLIRVRCPTCEGSFSSHEIEDHADVCAEAAWTGSEHLVYARLMADIENDDQDPLENQSAAEENNSYPIDQQDNWDHTTNDGSQAEIKAELIGTLQTLQTNLNTRTNRINVQRTSVLDDYIDARKRFHWMHPENRIKVVFIGEPAIDTGGPKREFCSGK